MYKKTGKRWVEYRDPIDLMGHPSDMQTMIRENWQLVTNELVEFDKEPIEVQNCKKFINHFGGFFRIYPVLMKENRRMSTCNQPVGLANIRISTGYAQESPQSHGMKNLQQLYQ